MAIIYTYPRVTDPDGTELIVVSETKNKNSTRLITLAGICEFCDESTGCDHSFKYIQTSSLTPAEAVGCDQTLELTSSDASIDITNTGNIIDFKGSAGGGCPTTYVLKPMSCNEQDECIIDQDAREWIFTCDPSFAPLIPGYVTLTNNASPVSYPIDPDFPLGEQQICWYAEAWNPIGKATSCETCCLPPGNPVITITPCGGTGPAAVSTLQSNIGGPVGWESAIDNPCQFGFAAGEFEDWPCLAISTGGVDTGTIVSLSEINTIAEPCSCECCIYPCSFHLIPCEGDLPPAFTPYVGGAVITHPNSELNCDFNDLDYVYIQLPGLEEWCFQLFKTCEEPQAVLDFQAVADCNEQICPGGGEVTYTWQECGGGPYITVAADPGVPVGQVDRYCCGDVPDITNYCYEYLGNIGQPVAGAFPCAGPIESYPDGDCECCLNPCTYKYTACPGYPVPFSEFIWVEVGFDETGCNCLTPDPDVYITIEDETWCYNTPVKECVSGSTLITGTALCGDEIHCPTPEVDLRWKKCSEGVESWRYEDELDPIPAPFNVPGNHYIGQLSVAGICANGDCCIEVEETISLGLAVPWSTFITETSCDSAYNETWEDCACCVYYDVAQYTACDPECNPEGGIPLPTVNIDVCAWGSVIGQSWKPASAPDFIKIFDCCYQKTGDICEAETFISGGYSYIPDLTYDPAFVDCTCIAAVFFQYRECGAEVWIDTSTDLTAWNTGGAWENLAGDTCYEIQIGGVGGPIVDPAILFVTENLGVGGLTPCDCCRQDLREYTICDGAAGVTCNALAPTTLYIDVSSIVGYDPITYATVVAEEISSSIRCCYTYVSPAVCQPATGTIITTVPTCEDEGCNLI